VQSSSQIITTNKPTPNLFYRPDALPVAQPTVSKHCHPVKACNSSLLHHMSQIVSSLRISISSPTFSITGVSKEKTTPPQYPNLALPKQTGYP